MRKYLKVWDFKLITVGLVNSETIFQLITFDYEADNTYLIKSHALGEINNM